MNDLTKYLVIFLVAISSGLLGDEFHPKEIVRISADEISRMIDSDVVKNFRVESGLKGNVDMHVEHQGGRKLLAWSVRTLKFSDLKLRSRNDGEFGGFFDITSKSKPSILLENKMEVHAVHQFRGGGFLVIGGICHLDEWKGKCLIFDESDGGVKMKFEFEFENGFPVYIGSENIGVISREGNAVIAMVKNDRLKSVILVGLKGIVGVDFTDKQIGVDKVNGLVHWSLVEGNE